MSSMGPEIYAFSVGDYEHFSQGMTTIIGLDSIDLLEHRGRASELRLAAYLIQYANKCLKDMLTYPHPVDAAVPGRRFHLAWYKSIMGEDNEISFTYQTSLSNKVRAEAVDTSSITELRSLLRAFGMPSFELVSKAYHCLPCAGTINVLLYAELCAHEAPKIHKSTN
eukprot:6113809-Amphidinium_carterae.1